MKNRIKDVDNEIELLGKKRQMEQEETISKEDDNFENYESLNTLSIYDKFPKKKGFVGARIM